MIPQVKTHVVDQNLCVGCGICVSECPTNSLKISWNEMGLFEPTYSDSCDNSGNCLKVCPFNPWPKGEAKDEDQIIKSLSPELYVKKSVLGHFKGLFIGHSLAHRETSSSGGIATWVLQKLLEEKIVDAVFAVGESNNDGFYGYKKVSSVNALLKLSHTKYYPVTLESLIDEISSCDDKVAITAIPCFIKALKLKQIIHPELQNKILFTVGIICGGMKSSFFTDYLIGKLKLDKNRVTEPSYRDKDLSSPANDYSFSCKSEGKSHSIKMKSVGDMWGTGLFKPYACEFCDDISGELADIAVGDAWLAPYVNDGAGNNIVISRSKNAENLLKKGIEAKEINLDKISYKKACLSQRGSYNHRRIGLRFRLKVAKRNGIKLPPKREKDSYFINPFFIRVQKQRLRVRELSFKIWNHTKDTGQFDNAIKTDLEKLKRYTKQYHLTRYFKLSNYINKVRFLFKV
jgi:coenzyme F420-reducing hydrogenase beta subunit